MISLKKIMVVPFLLSTYAQAIEIKSVEYRTASQELCADFEYFGVEDQEFEVVTLDSELTHVMCNIVEKKPGSNSNSRKRLKKFEKKREKKAVLEAKIQGYRDEKASRYHSVEEYCMPFEDPNRIILFNIGGQVLETDRN